MNFQKSFLSSIHGSASAEDKCEFAKLKYEQLLKEKFFIETCFSKIFESYPPDQKLKDMLFRIKIFNCK